jgi:hypothetical protein
MLHREIPPKNFIEAVLADILRVRIWECPIDGWKSVRVLRLQQYLSLEETWAEDLYPMQK